MRIIHGKYKGFQFPAYHGINTRPTSDLVKESLFNTLDAFLDFDGLEVIDLFAGTGNIGLECLSRGAAGLVSIDHMPANIRYMEKIKKELAVVNWDIKKADALKFTDKPYTHAGFIFADPPYDYAPVHELVSKILNWESFTSKPSVFVLEHNDRLVFKHKHVFLTKQYGNTSFTCFRSGSVTE